MLIGICLGILLGLVGGVVPGLQPSIIYLYLIQTQQPFTALGIIVGSYSIFNILNNSQQLIELYQASDPLFQATLKKAKKVNKVVDCIYLSANSEFAGFTLACIGGSLLLITGQGELLKEFLKNFSWLGVYLAGMLWGAFIWLSPNKILAALVIGVAGFIGWGITLQGDPYSFLSIGTALFVIAPGVLKS